MTLHVTEYIITYEKARSTKNKNILLIVFILHQYYNKDDFNCQVDSAASFFNNENRLWYTLKFKCFTWAKHWTSRYVFSSFFVLLFCYFLYFCSISYKIIALNKMQSINVVMVFLISTLHNLSTLSFPLGKYLFKVNDEDARTLFS